ncbi:hypothetical protein LMG3410_06210 [Achromobacter aegrifaciens]|nr:hypothetical protein LMG3410_06210 [Achromobacter aegrifaciens]
MRGGGDAGGDVDGAARAGQAAVAAHCDAHGMAVLLQLGAAVARAGRAAASADRLHRQRRGVVARGLDIQPASAAGGQDVAAVAGHAACAAKRGADGDGALGLVRAIAALPAAPADRLQQHAVGVVAGGGDAVAMVVVEEEAQDTAIAAGAAAAAHADDRVGLDLAARGAGRSAHAAAPAYGLGDQAVGPVAGGGDLAGVVHGDVAAMAARAACAAHVHAELIRAVFVVEPFLVVAVIADAVQDGIGRGVGAQRSAQPAAAADRLQQHAIGVAAFGADGALQCRIDAAASGAGTAGRAQAHLQTG